MANDITLKVGIDSSDAQKGLDEVVKKSADAAGEAQSKFSDVFKGAFAGGALANVGGQIAGVLQEGVASAIDAGNKFEGALQSVSAVTGVTGQGLNDLGTRAQDLALQFGGSATTQLEAFQTVLSKFGPDLAKTPEALGTVAESVNVLGKAAGLDAKQSVDALSNAMLQFGVDASDPAKLAAESGRFINVLAASAKVGAAEIPQVSEAILQAGVAAKGAGLTFEETNAAIQGLAVGGKVGSEAGISLRNVISKLIDGGGEQKKVLASVGLSYKELGNTLTTSAAEGGGLAAALEKLKGGLEKITNPAERAAAAGKLFGAENASAAGILLDQVDNIKLFTEGVTGTNEATVQAAINQDTLASRFDKVKAAIEVGLIKAFQALTPIVKFIFDNFATIATYLAPLAIGLAAVGVAALIASPSFVAMAGGIGAATGATIAWTAALLVNPIFLIATAAAAAVVGIVALADAMSTSTQEQIDNAEAQKKGIEQQQQMNKEMQQGEIQTQTLVNEFKALAEKTDLSAKEQKRLQEIQSKLEEKYPKLIDATKSYKENLKGVEQVGKTSTDALGKLKDQSAELEKEFQRASREIIRGKRELALGDLYSSTTTFLGGATALTDKVQEFKDAIYGAKTTTEIDAATLKLIRITNQLGDAGFGGAEKRNKFVASIRDAAQQAASYVDFYKKKVEEPTETKIKVKTEDDTNKEDDNNKKRKKDLNAQVESIMQVLDLEKQRQTNNEIEAKAVAEQLGLGEISKEQKKELLIAEKARLELLLNADGKQVEYFDKQYKSIVEIGKITKDVTGKNITGIAGNDKDKEKVLKTFDDIRKKVSDIGLALNKISATESVEGFKTEFDRLRLASEDLRKAVPEKLTTKYAFTIDEETYQKEIDKLKADFEQAEIDLNAIKVNGDAKQQEEINKILKDNLEKRKEIESQYANITERIKIERQTDAEKRKLDIALFDLRIKFEKEQEENKGNYTKLQELENAYLSEREKLQEEYRQRNNLLYGVQSAVQSAIQKQFNISRLIEERKANEAIREEKRKSLADEESDLEKSLADRSITFDEYQTKIAEINKKRIDAGLIDEKLGDKLLQDIKIAGDQAFAQIANQQGEKLATQANARREQQVVLDAKVNDAAKKLAELKGKGTLDEFAKAQEELNKAQQDAAQNDADVYGFRTSILEEYAGKALNQFAALAATGKATLADFGKVTLQLAFEVLQKQIPIWVASIFGEEVSKMGLAGLATSAALTAGLYGLFAAAQSAAGFKDGVVGLQGAGTETSDSIPAWLSKGESVITARATASNVDALKWVNNTGLPLKEFYRNQFSQTSVNESGELIREIRELRKTTEGLGMQISRNTHVKVDGMLVADGNSITAMIESNRKRNSRRF